MLTLIDAEGIDRAAERFCRETGCTRATFTTDLGFFLPARCDGTVVELGGGFGDDTLRYAARSKRVISLVPSLTGAQVLSRRLHAERCENVEPAVVRDLSRLPLESGFADAIVVDESALDGFDLSRSALPAAVAEWRRVLRRDGSLVCGLRGSSVGRWALTRLRAAGRPGARLDSLNRRLQSNGRGSRSALGYRRVLRVLKAAGFVRPQIHAPLPHENDIALVLPLRQRPLTDYGLDQMLRSNSLIARTAITCARAANRLGALEYLAPFYFVLLRRGD